MLVHLLYERDFNLYARESALYEKDTAIRERINAMRERYRHIRERLPQIRESPSHTYKLQTISKVRQLHHQNEVDSIKK